MNGNLWDTIVYDVIYLPKFMLPMLLFKFREVYCNAVCNIRHNRDSGVYDRVSLLEYALLAHVVIKVRG